MEPYPKALDSVVDQRRQESHYISWPVGAIAVTERLQNARGRFAGTLAASRELSVISLAARRKTKKPLSRAAASSPDRLCASRVDTRRATQCGAGNSGCSRSEERRVGKECRSRWGVW